MGKHTRHQHRGWKQRGRSTNIDRVRPSPVSTCSCARHLQRYHHGYRYLLKAAGGNGVESDESLSKMRSDMSSDHVIRFVARLRRPASPGTGEPWAFLVLPKTASDILPRRGRTTVEGAINGHPFRAVLDPDGQLSHWLKVDRALLEAIDADIGDEVDVRIKPSDREQEPQLPDDLREALAAAPEAAATWDATT